MKRTSVLLFLMCLAGPLAAAPAVDRTAVKPLKDAPPPVAASDWKKEVIANLSINQVEFDNWSQGGEDSLSWQAGLKSKFTRDNSKANWANGFGAAYGRTRLEGAPSRKTTDELNAESVYTHKMGGYLNPFLSVSGRTQLTAGYKTVAGMDVKTSAFLDPGYFTESAGVGYMKGESFTTRLGAALKQTVTRDFNGWADDPSTPGIETVRSEVGATSVTEFKQKLGAASLFSSKLDLFSNLKGTDQVDARWDNALSSKVTKLLSFGAELSLLYDRDISKKRQLKQLLMFGFSYSLL